MVEADRQDARQGTTLRREGFTVVGSNGESTGLLRS